MITLHTIAPPGPPIWRSSNGLETPIRDLTDTHIINILNYFWNFRAYLNHNKPRWQMVRAVAVEAFQRGLISSRTRNHYQ